MIKIFLFNLRSQEKLTGEENSQSAFINLTKKKFRFINFNTLNLNLFEMFLVKFSRFFKLFFMCKKNIPEIIILKVPVASHIFFVMPFTSKFKGRLIVWVDGCFWKMPPLRIFFIILFKEPFLTFARICFNNSFWMRFLNKKNIEIVVSSEFQLNQLDRYLNDFKSYTLIPNTIHLKEKLNKRKIITRRIKEPVFGYIGHTYITKGFDDFVNAVILLKSNNIISNHNVFFALSNLGNKKIRNKLISIGIHPSGKIHHESFYQSIDFLVVPYWVEWGTNIFPSVLLESLYFGIPVITTNNSVVSEFYNFNDKLFIDVPINNHVELANVLKKFLLGNVKFPNKRDLEMHYKSIYSQDVVANKWTKFLSHQQN